MRMKALPFRASSCRAHRHPPPHHQAHPPRHSLTSNSLSSLRGSIVSQLLRCSPRLCRDRMMNGSKHHHHQHQCHHGTISSSSCSSPSPHQQLNGKTPSSDRCKGGGHALTPQNIPERIVQTEYAVRGKVVEVADELRKQLQTNPGSLPFEEVIACNIGNPQAVGQHPISYISQLMALAADEGLRKNPNSGYPSDLVEFSRQLDKSVPSLGAYSESRGILYLRERLASWMTQRDDHPTDPKNIYLCNGASAGITEVMGLLLDKPEDGVMIPIPQYPLYSATLTKVGASPVNYYLTEEKGWTLEAPELERAYDGASREGVDVKAIVIINPSNPTGSVLSEETLRQIVLFCERRRLVILADEVYQENCFHPEEKPFLSFRKIVLDMRSPVEVFSFHSASKGFAGNCGVRGGMVHCENLNAAVEQQVLKLFTLNLCANIPGQVAFTAQCTPPMQGMPSYDTYIKQRSAIEDSLRKKAEIVTKRLDSIEGISCQPITGAMYAFPRITLPPRLQEHAKQTLNMQPDMFYCLELLRATGIVTVPGSGFGQREGTFHFRMTLLPPLEKFNKLLDSIEKFHREIVEKYS